MQSLKQKAANFGRRLFRIIIFIMCLCCLCVSLYYSYGQMNEYKALKAVEEDIAKRMEKEDKTQQELELELERNMTDAYVEQIAREKLGLVKSTDIKFESK